MIQNTIKNTIQNTIQNTINVYESLKPATKDMTLTASWTSRDLNYQELGSTVSASVRVDATINNTDSGILMESGATIYGLILYVYNGVLYFQCGDGSDYGISSTRAELTYTLPVGEADYVVEWSANQSKAVLYINGVLVDSQNYYNTVLGGSDSGGIGLVHTSVARNRGSWGSSNPGVYTNIINKCDIFNNQITLDV